MKLCNNFRTHFHNINLQYLDKCSFSFYCFNSCSGRVVPVVWQHWWCISICFSLKHVPFCLWGPGPALSQWVSGPWRRHMWKYKSFLNVYSHVLKRAWTQTRAELSSMWLPRICSLIRRQVILLFLFLSSLQRPKFHLAAYCCRTSSGLCNAVLRFTGSWKWCYTSSLNLPST